MPRGPSRAATKGPRPDHEGDAKSWSVSGELKVDSTPGYWLRRTVADIGADRVQAVEIEIGNDHYTATKKARSDADFTMTGVPKGRELSSPSAANGLATALSNFELEDVRPAAELADKSTARATFKTFDGLVIDAEGWNHNDKQYVVLKPHFDESLARQFHVAAKPAGDAATSAADGIDTVIKNGNADAEALNGQVQGWAYEVQIYRYQEIFKPVEELLKKEEPKQKPQGKTGAKTADAH